MVKQLFEEKVTGSIPETMYKTMVAQYCDEKDDLCAELDNLEKALDNKENEEVDILRWVDNMLAFVNIKEFPFFITVSLLYYLFGMVNPQSEASQFQPSLTREYFENT